MTIELQLTASERLHLLETAHDTGGRRLLMEATYLKGHAPLRHYHPQQDEHFEVLTGVVRVELNGTTRDYAAGETIDVPRRTVHSFFNPFAEPVKLRWEVTPALDTQLFFETVAGLAKDGKMGADGRPGLLQLAMLISGYGHVFRAASPPWAVQRVLALLLAPIARRMGYRARYPEYSGPGPQPPTTG